MILGIDASTVGSGGAKRHLIELLKCYDPSIFGFSKIKIWGRQSVLDQITDYPWLVKISHPLLNKSLVSRTIWQLFCRDRQFRNEIDILFNPFGTYIGKFRPYATMSRNMLVFDRNEQKRFGLSWYRLKFILLFFVQRKSFRNSQGLIFISNYARDYIARYVDYSNKKVSVIHHGLSGDFVRQPVLQKPIGDYSEAHPLVILYVSTVFQYKHQLTVVDAVDRLRKKGLPVTLKLIGGVGEKEFGDKLEQRISQADPAKEFIEWQQHIGLKEVVKYYHSSDVFVFASSCENMPNILMEAMGSSLPIACSSSPPMPEFMEDAGLYFEADDTDQLEQALLKMVNDRDLRTELAHRASEKAKKYSWKICADNTFQFLESINAKA